MSAGGGGGGGGGTGGGGGGSTGGGGGGGDNPGVRDDGDRGGFNEVSRSSTNEANVPVGYVISDDACIGGKYEKC